MSKPSSNSTEVWFVTTGNYSQENIALSFVVMVALLWELSEPEFEQIKDQLTLYSRDNVNVQIKGSINVIFKR